MTRLSYLMAHRGYLSHPIPRPKPVFGYDSQLRRIQWNLLVFVLIRLYRGWKLRIMNFFEILWAKLGVKIRFLDLTNLGQLSWCQMSWLRTISCLGKPLGNLSTLNAHRLDFWNRLNYRISAIFFDFLVNQVRQVFSATSVYQINFHFFLNLAWTTTLKNPANLA